MKGCSNVSSKIKFFDKEKEKTPVDTAKPYRSAQKILKYQKWKSIVCKT